MDKQSCQNQSLFWINENELGRVHVDEDTLVDDDASVLFTDLRFGVVTGRHEEGDG